MGIKNINLATCDVCGRTYSSEKKQSELLKELKSAGWEGSITTLKCPSCSTTSKSYYGLPESVRKIGDTYYVVVVSETQKGRVTVYVPYKQLAPFDGNTIPSIETVRNTLSPGGEPTKIKYTIREKKHIEGRYYLIAEKR